MKPQVIKDLSDAAQIIDEVQYQIYRDYGSQPSAPWRKLVHAGNYLQDQQDKALAEILRDPFAPYPGQVVMIDTPFPAQSWLDKVLSKLFS